MTPFCAQRVFAAPKFTKVFVAVSFCCNFAFTPRSAGASPPLLRPPPRFTRQPLAMARGLSRDQSRDKNLKKAAGKGKGQSESNKGLTPAQVRERCVAARAPGTAEGLPMCQCARLLRAPGALRGGGRRRRRQPLPFAASLSCAPRHDWRSRASRAPPSPQLMALCEVGAREAKHRARHSSSQPRVVVSVCKITQLVKNEYQNCALVACAARLCACADAAARCGGVFVRGPADGGVWGGS